MPLFDVRTLESNTEEIIEFSSSFPWKPTWSQESIRDFLAHLISDRNLVFDFWRDGKRVAVAVLIDRAQNKGNHACLEWLGIKPNLPILKLYEHALHLAKSRLNPSKSGIEITLHDSLSELFPLLKNQNFNSYYDTFEMICKIPKLSPIIQSDSISRLLEKDYAECYEVISKSFEHNLDICIPSFEDWKRARVRSRNSVTWVFKENDRILGFLNLLTPYSGQTPPNAEIRSVGVLPNHRGKGIGQKLLQFAIQSCSESKALECRLTVATQNSRALNLYQELGFQIHDHYQVFSWKVR